MIYYFTSLIIKTLQVFFQGDLNSFQADQGVLPFSIYSPVNGLNQVTSSSPLAGSGTIVLIVSASEGTRKRNKSSPFVRGNPLVERLLSPSLPLVVNFDPGGKRVL